MSAHRAAIVTVGSELVEGLRVDTNTAEIARALGTKGFVVTEAISVGDDESTLAAAMKRLLATCDLVVTTGGLGPTHDDITREAASEALGLPLSRDERIVGLLTPLLARHDDARAREQLLVQADVLHGAEVIDPTTGTAPGQVVPCTGGATLALLPGPPSEMRPMLAAALSRYPSIRSEPVEIGVTGLSESDAQVRASAALDTYADVGFTILARPGDVRVLLFDNGAGAKGLAAATDAVSTELGEAAYSTMGESLAEATVRALSDAGLTAAVAESCTGGMIGSAITDVAGSSDVFMGGVVAYANEAKTDLLDVPAGLLAQYGAVSEETARAMAEGARARFGSDVAAATTGIAGPGGGSPEKPVGLVWFALATATSTRAYEKRYPPGSSRAAIRDRAAAFALDLLRREAGE